ncbi:MAG: DUF1611 domain-containing protein [Azospirillum sp.]|nr:DUF1611 domain-containing protein [Azospirillum sp.]MCA3267609.1 DUF1611 domain-containing protein [Azospirillum sp.]MCZ8124274.1 DUF1611 domain-containing protein [Magnetospirillum sp.]
MEIKAPYLLFLGDAADALAAKTSIGVGQWRPEKCLGQVRLPGCKADSGFPDMTAREAAAKGAKTMIVGTVNRGGVISKAWMKALLAALDAGLDLASGLHNRLSDVPELARAAARKGRRLIDVRHPDREFPIATGAKRAGKRVLTVGTDCSIGKMYTSLALEKAMKARGMKATFRATGQTGILIAGSGWSIDAIVSDFVAGAVETLSPANHPDHWDVIEGQGSLFHASYAGVTMALIHGAQADALVMCHEPGRPHMRGLPHYKLPDIETCIAVNVAHARLTNPKAKCVGVSLNTSKLTPKAAERAIKATADRLGLPCVDPSRTGVDALVAKLAKIK